MPRRTAQSLARLITRLANDDAGGEIMEWVLIGGLIIVAAITTITAFGGKVLARWTSVNGSM
jgi:pilus assembly protein Flp/PilA